MLDDLVLSVLIGWVGEISVVVKDGNFSGEIFGVWVEVFYVGHVVVGEDLVVVVGRV